MLSKVLVANRGEIACRVLRACRELGIRTVAVFSEADRDAKHVALADEAFLLGPPPAVQSYLSQERILAAAEATGAEAIHPGYGFLSENAEFARRCAERGLVFVGPRPEAIAAMGEKIAARRLVADLGVPVVPGTRDALPEDADPLIAAAEIGYPLLVKASAGGGGIGMSVVHTPPELEPAIRTARSRAARAFGNAEVFLERFLPGARHVEVQVVGDSHGHVVHLFERDCSVQRRYQKVLEETPAPRISESLRQDLTSAAAKIARGIGYTNAGTVECVLDAENCFYFLEMNTRLQVEHPITEAVTGCDLVKTQLRVAAGAPLEFSQEDVRQYGHAIECRVYAEDPDRMLPSPGRITHYLEPSMPGVRVDSGVSVGSEVTVYYDPLLAKVIAWGSDRSVAIERMTEALQAFEIEGVKTNIPLHLRVLRHQAFVTADYDTGLLTAEDFKGGSSPL